MAGLSSIILLLAAFAPTCISYTAPPQRPGVWNRPTIFKQAPSMMHQFATKKPGKGVDDEEESQLERPKEPTQPMTLFEYAEKERRAARDLNNRLLLPDRIGKAVNTTLYAFVILGIILNIFGFAFVRKSDGSLTIDTIAARRFQNEISRTTMSPGPRKSTPTE